MKQDRLKKLEGIIQELASRFVFEEIEDTEKTFGVITITGVKVSSDLSYLDIYVSCFKDKELLPKMLATHAHAVQKKISQQLPLRKIPRVRFRYDETGANSYELTSHINDLSDEIQRLGGDSSQNT